MLHARKSSRPDPRPVLDRALTHTIAPRKNGRYVASASVALRPLVGGLRVARVAQTRRHGREWQSAQHFEIAPGRDRGHVEAALRDLIDRDWARERRRGARS
jgi:hypothetical protein